MRTVQIRQPTRCLAFRRLLAAMLALLACLCHEVGAQSSPGEGEPEDMVTQENSTGVEAFGSYSGLRENINLQNRNLNVIIPLFTLRGRNGFDFSVAANYNSIQKQWVDLLTTSEGVCTYPPIPNSGADRFEIELAPRLTYEEGVQPLEQEPGGEGYPIDSPRQNRYVLREMDGTRYEFRSAERVEDVLEYAQTRQAERFRSTSSSSMSLQEAPGADPVLGTTDADVYLRNGPHIHFPRIFGYQPDWMQDRNGNRISFDYANGQLAKVTDTLGREVTRIIFKNAQNQIIRTEISYKDASGQSVLYTLERDVPGPDQDTLTLPSGLRYVFHYGETEEFGSDCLDTPPTTATDYRLMRIDYPSGGWVEYDYGTFPAANPTKSVLTAVRRCSRADGQCLPGQEAIWLYDEPGPVRVTRPDGTYSEHVFGLPAGSGLFEDHELETRFYEADGTLLRTVQNTWEEFWHDPKIVRTDETLHVTDSSGPDQTRRTEMDYDSTGYVQKDQSGTVLGQASQGDLLESRAYDWGDGIPGALLRKVKQTYLTNPAYGLTAGHILGLTTRRETFDGQGRLEAQSDFVYDDYASPWSLIDISDLEQHDASSGTGHTVRGNLSRRTDWLDTGPDLVSRFRYDIAGNLREQQSPRADQEDPSGFKSVTLYEEATEYALPASVTNPLGHTQSFTYDFNEDVSGVGQGLGLVTSTTDANNQVTSMTHDILGRVKTIQNPDGGQTFFYHSDLDYAAQHNGQPVFPKHAPPAKKRTVNSPCATRPLP